MKRTRRPPRPQRRPREQAQGCRAWASHRAPRRGGAGWEPVVSCRAPGARTETGSPRSAVPRAPGHPGHWPVRRRDRNAQRAAARTTRVPGVRHPPPAAPAVTRDRAPVGGSSAARRWAGPEGRFHVKQGPRPSPTPRDGSPVDRRTCRRHAPVIPTRSGWSVRTPSRVPYPRSHRGAYGPAGAIVTRCARHPPAPHYRRAVSLRGTGAAGPSSFSGGTASDRVGAAPPDFPVERRDPQRQEKLSGRAFGYRATASAPSWLPEVGPPAPARSPPGWSAGRGCRCHTAAPSARHRPASPPPRHAR